MAAESDVWSSPSKYELPARSYLKELTLAVAVPVLLTLTAVAALTAVLCFHYAGMLVQLTKCLLAFILRPCNVMYQR